MANQRRHAVPTLTGSAAAVMFILGCSSAFANNSFKENCPEANDSPPSVEIQSPALVLRTVDLGLTDSSADMKDPASEPSTAEITSSTTPALADVADVSLTDSNETASSVKEDDAIPSNKLPETALRLPGISEESQPRFRRQMYRTDI